MELLDLEKDFKLLEQGAEARIYMGEYLGLPSIVKHRFSKKYRHPLLDTKLIKDRLKAEVRSLIKVKSLGIKTPTIYLTDLESSVIIMEYIQDSVRCRDYLNKLLETRKENEGKLEKLMEDIGTILGRIHMAGIIHGDLTTSNILVRENMQNDTADLFLIDFGLGYSEGTPEDKGVDIYVLERALISTHPNTEDLFMLIMEAYRKKIGKSKNAVEIIAKYEEIRMRGRKRTMVG